MKKGFIIRLDNINIEELNQIKLNHMHLLIDYLIKLMMNNKKEQNRKK